MNQEELTDALKALDQRQEGEAEQLASRLLAECREAPRSVISLINAENTVVAERAREVFLGMEDTIVVPVSEVGSAIEFSDHLFLTETAVEAEVQLRRALAASLEKLLDNYTPLPPPNFGRVEEPQPTVRVCDQAYLQLRRLMNSTESHGDTILNNDRFLRGSFEERDAELKELQKSHRFTNFMTDSPDGER